MAAKATFCELRSALALSQRTNWTPPQGSCKWPLIVVEELVEDGGKHAERREIILQVLKSY